MRVARIEFDIDDELPLLLDAITQKQDHMRNFLRINFGEDGHHPDGRPLQTRERIEKLQRMYDRIAVVK